MIAGGEIISSVAFSGSSLIFGQLGVHGKAEMKQHNLTMEQLSKAREEYNIERQ